MISFPHKGGTAMMQNNKANPYRGYISFCGLTKRIMLFISIAILISCAPTTTFASARNSNEGFEDGIVGHKSGDKFDLSLTFPKDYHAEQLAGKKVVFEVLLKQVNAITAPEINDELAAKAGPFKTSRPTSKLTSRPKMNIRPTSSTKTHS